MLGGYEYMHVARQSRCVLTAAACTLAMTKWKCSDVIWLACDRKECLISFPAKPLHVQV